MLTTKAILDRVFTRIADNSSGTRIRLLAWLNSAMQDVVNERAWTFLDKSVSLTLSANKVTLPSDFGRETFIRNGRYFFTVGDRLTPELAAQIDVAGGEPYGYSLTTTELTVHPSASGTLTLYYTAEFPEAGYLDGIEETLFPQEFLPLFERYLLTGYYEYDVDEARWGAAAGLDQKQLSRLKKLDNLRKPLPQLDPRGMVRQ